MGPSYIKVVDQNKFKRELCTTLGPTSLVIALEKATNKTFFTKLFFQHIPFQGPGTAAHNESKEILHISFDETFR